MRITVALIKVARVNLVNLVATKAVVSAITATGVNGASAHNVPKPALVNFLDHPTGTINVPKLRSHSHAILMLARTAVKQPLQIYLFILKSNSIINQFSANSTNSTNSTGITSPKGFF